MPKNKQTEEIGQMDLKTAFSPHKIKQLGEIVSSFDSFFFDMYGVLWDGSNFYPGVLSLLEQLKKNNRQIYILSNITSLRKKFISDKAKNGLIYKIHYDDVITSSDVCAHAIKNGLFQKITGHTNYRVSIIGKENTEMFFPIISHLTNNLKQADVIYLSGVQTNKMYKTINHWIPALKEAVSRNLPAICANPDLTFMSQDKELPTQGSLAHWYETHGGYVYYFGKPYYNIFEYTFKLTGVNIKRSLMIGDTLSTDILGAQNTGMKTLLVTETGVTGYYQHKGISLEEQFKKAKTIPDFIIPYL